MTNQELARYYRGIADKLEFDDIRIATMLRDRADELDPSRPSGGTVVWWRYNPRYASTHMGRS